jgi:hypothetical protein
MIAKERQKAMDDPANVFADDSDKAKRLPLFCVGCGITFEPDDMVDIVHIVPYVGDEYNAYYHHEELKPIDDDTIKKRKLLSTKRASEIVSDLNNHREAKEREPKTGG